MTGAGRFALNWRFHPDQCMSRMDIKTISLSLFSLVLIVIGEQGEEYCPIISCGCYGGLKKLLLIWASKYTLAAVDMLARSVCGNLRMSTFHS